MRIYETVFKSERMLLIPDEESMSASRYMAYITEDKLGLQKFPLTGNPYDSIAIFAHPDGVSEYTYFSLTFLVSVLGRRFKYFGKKTYIILVIYD